MKLPRTTPSIPSTENAAALAEVEFTAHFQPANATANATPSPEAAPTLRPLATVPDAAAAELLAPATATPSAPTPVDGTPVPVATGGSDYPPMPDDNPTGTSPPIDPGVERAAWIQLMAFIHAHKDAGTTVVAADADAFMQGLE